MGYGSNRDEGIYYLSSMYKEIMNKLNIKYENIHTEDGISDGKYVTVITLQDNTEIKLDTSAWNGIEVVTKKYLPEGKMGIRAFAINSEKGVKTPSWRILGIEKCHTIRSK